MEGKTVILSVLIMSLVMAQIQVEAKSCCPTKAARRRFDRCIRSGRRRLVCAGISRCLLIPNRLRCPPCCRNEILENSGDDVNEYCNWGCASSVCGALTTLDNSDNQDANEIVNETVEKCTKACSTLCATGSKTALDQIALDQSD